MAGVHHADRRLLIADHTVGLSADTEPGLAELAAALAGGAHTDRLAELHLHAQAVAVTRPERPADRTAQHVSYWHSKDHVVMATHDRQLAVVRADSATLDARGGGARGLRALLFPVLTELFAGRGRCLLHAAAFAGGRGAVLVLGGSGQGKSTTITAALEAGHGALSDDLVVLETRQQSGGGSELIAYGVPQPLALPADLGGGPVIGEPIEGDPRDRRNAGPSVALLSDGHRVRSVLLVGHATTPLGHVLPATAMETFHRALNSNLDGMTVGAARQVFPFATAIARLPAWRLSHGQDATTRLGTALTAIATATAAITATATS